MKTQDLFKLDNKVAIVTGGSMGIGKDMCIGLAEMGATVVVASRKLDLCEQTVNEIKQFGGKAIAVRCDVANPADCEALVAKTIEELGTVDILVNDAGYTWGAPAENFPLDKFEQIFRVNVTGSFVLAAAVARHMIERKKPGRIINVSSLVAAKGCFPESQNAVAYCASKGAVSSMTRDLAVKWARHGITVNAIAPGFFVTHMTEYIVKAGFADAVYATIPLGRAGSTEDIKGLVIFLASEASSFITGQIIGIDGGAAAL